LASILTPELDIPCWSILAGKDFPGPLLEDIDDGFPTLPPNQRTLMNQPRDGMILVVMDPFEIWNPTTNRLIPTRLEHGHRYAAWWGETIPNL